MGHAGYRVFRRVALGAVTVVALAVGTFVLVPLRPPSPAQQQGAVDSDVAAVLDESIEPLSAAQRAPSPDGIGAHGASPAAASAPSGDWWQQVEASLRAQEYDVTPAEPRGLSRAVHRAVVDPQTLPPLSEEALQAPNRVQGFRTYFLDGAVAVVPREESGAPWMLSLDELSIGRVRAAGAGLRKLDAAEPQHSARNVFYEDEQVLVRYENREAGLEQSFTVDSPPPGEGRLVVAMRVGGLLARAAGEQRAVLKSAGGTARLSYGPIRAWDAAGRDLSAAIRVRGTDQILLVVDDENSTYPVFIDPLLTTAAWTGSGDQAGGKFGVSVSGGGDLNGDGADDIAVGAFQYDGGQANAGRVFIYLGSSSGLSTVANVSVGLNQASAEFGRSVSIVGDVNGDGRADLLVGAYLFDGGGTDSGAAFLYLGKANGLATSPGWTFESEQAASRLGFSVARAGDVNGDGYADAIVGAYLYDANTTNDGRVYVFHGSAGGLSDTPSWTKDGSQASGQFGVRVSSAGDVNADGYDDVAVGAFLFDGGQTDEGKAYVYHGSASGLQPDAAWTAEGNQANARFGRGLAGAGDVNDDGFDDLVVGAQLYDAGQTDEGRVFLYVGSQWGLRATPRWTAESNQASAQMGLCVSGAGDVNGDGFDDLVVGAHGYDAGQSNEGRAYLYYGTGSGLAASPAWTGESNAASAYFGFSVSGAGDVNADGHSDIIIGAHGWDGPTDAGRAYVFYGAPDGVPVEPDWTADGGQAGEKLGSSVSGAGDVNGDGFADVIVGAPLYDGGLADAGRVLVFSGGAGGLSGAASWILDGDQAGAQFGVSVAGAGDVNGDGYDDLVVGAGFYDDAAPNQGRAYVYRGAATGISGTASWVSGGPPAEEAWFGRCVAGVGDVNTDGYDDVVVAAPGDARAYAYYGSATGLNPSIFQWQGMGTVEVPSFGMAMSAAGDVNNDGYADVIIGAPEEGPSSNPPTQVGEGRAYMFYGSASGLPVPAVPSWEYTASQVGSQFGSGVAGAGDVNGDGFDDVIVGARRHKVGTDFKGRAVVFLGASGGPDLVVDWTGEIDEVNGEYGISVDGAGDYNGDGYDDVVIGGSKSDSGEIDEGRIFIVLGGPTGLRDWHSVEGQSDQINAWLGVSVSGVGDINGDGYDDIVAGASGWDVDTETNAGRVFAYYGGPQCVTDADCSDGLFCTGADRCIAGVCRMGVPRYVDDEVSCTVDVCNEDADLVENTPVDANCYDGIVCNGAESCDPVTDCYPGVVLTGEACHPGPTAGARFGYSVADAGDLDGDGFSDFAVGAPYFANGSANEGQVSVYRGNVGALVGSGLLGSYYNNSDFTSLVLERIDPVVNFNWGSGSPDPSIGADTFSIRWEGEVSPRYSETYTFYTTGDDGMRLWVNGMLIIDDWTTHPPTERTSITLSLNADAWYSVKMEFFENGGGAVAQLRWSSASQGKEIIPEARTRPGAAWWSSGGPQAWETGVASWTDESDVADALFGASVAGAGDVDGDGFDDLLIGGYGADTVWLYRGSATGPGTAADWTATGEGVHQFGVAVASAGDVNGDGYDDIVVGAAQFSSEPAQTDEGKIYVYLGSPSGLEATASWTYESNVAGAQLGASVSSAGDVNGDGYDDIVVAAPTYTNGELEEGVAWVFHGSVSGLAAAPSWALEGNAVGARLGTSVSGAHDVDGDGSDDVVVGVPYYTNGETDEGAIHIFRGAAGTGLGAAPAWTVEGNQMGALFGSSVHGAGFVDGDAFADILVGAPLYDDTFVDEGAAFVLLGSLAGPQAVPYEVMTGMQAGARLGASVVGVADFDGNGAADMIVGAPDFDDDPGADSGAIFAAFGWSCETDLDCDDGQYCNGVETCLNGACWRGASVGCSSMSDACNIGTCNEGIDDCEPVPRPVATPCGNLSDTDCTNPDTCDGAGVCLANHEPAATACGNPTSDTCTAPDTCDGLGVCLPNHAVVGTACGDPTDTACTAPDTCGASGTCLANHAAAGAACGDQGVACLENDSCDGAGTCIDNGYSAVGTACGDPADTACTDADTCDGSGGCAGNDVVNGVACDDGYSCSSSDVCLEGVCEPATAGTADDCASGSAAAEQLGYSVADVGDVNGDGFPDLIVGAPYYSNGQAEEGRAYLYLGNLAGYDGTAVWTVEGGQAGAWLGASVAGAGDVNQDGYDDVIVGAHGYDGAEGDEGRVTVYLGTASGVAATPAWTQVGEDGGDQLGFAVASAGDVSGDGVDDIIIGAHFFDTNNGQADEGKVYVYRGSAAGLESTAWWSFEADQKGAELGASVAGAGDVNGDSVDDVIIGAPLYDGALADSGAAFVFYGAATGLAATADWTMEGPQSAASYGASVASAGDVNGDGIDEVIVGAPLYDNAFTDEGAAWVYDGGAGGLSTTASWTTEGGQAGALWGWSVASAGDANEDGTEDIIVGAPGFDNGEVDEGTASVFRGSGSGLEATAWEVLEGDQNGAALGRSVTGARETSGGGRAAWTAGAPLYDDLGTDSGAVFMGYGGAPCSVDADCADTLFCNGVESCVAGRCRPGAVVDCSGLDDACNLGECNEAAGACQAVPLPSGTVCGDPTTSECTAPDSCDGAGTCAPNHMPVGAACGDQGVACYVDDACDGQGSCIDLGPQPAGALCGDPTDTACTSPDFCDGAGACLPNHALVGEPCGDQGVVCLLNDTCDGVGACVDAGFVPAGGPCGDATSTACTSPDSCDGAGACLANHAVAGAPCGDQGVDCRVDDACDGVGACIDAGLKAVGDPCGSAVSDACTQPDTCDASGVCLDNHAAVNAPCGDQGVDCRLDDVCNGLGICVDRGDAPIGTPCGDATATECTAADTCLAGGVCSANDLPVGTACGDQSVACNVDDACDGAGACVDNGTVLDGTPCDDGLFCTVTDICSAGACGGSPRDCSAIGDVCAGGVCNDVDDRCDPGAPKPDGTACNDGLFCTIGETCLAGVCQVGSARDCSSAGDACNDGFCNEATTTCEPTPKPAGTACGDTTDDACTDPDSCDGAGACVARHAPAGAPCGDQGVDCHQDDQCDGNGACADSGFQTSGTACGSPSSDACTAPDTCDNNGGCLANDIAAGAPCGDQGVDCLVDDTCDGAGACVDQGFAGAGTQCGDSTNDACTDPDACDGAGNCQPRHATAGAPCGDQDVPCSVDDVCDGLGSCIDLGFAPAGTACGDATDDACTASDTCDDAGACQDNHSAAGTACGDQNVDCLVDDACDGAGVCVDSGLEPAGTVCGDATDDACTDPDTCDGSGACLGNHAAAGSPCGDQGVTCMADDGCDGAGACQDAGALPNGTTCDDGVFCTDPDICTDGTCGGSPRDCSGAGDSCRGGTCDEGGQQCVPDPTPKPDGTPCEDGLFCTSGDACAGGTCQPGSARDCSGVADACNNATCNEGLGQCEAVPKAAGTPCGDSANTECTLPDSCDGSGACQANDAPAGAACGDQGQPCLVDDACDGLGACEDNGFVSAGTACGDTANTECNAPDSCDGAGTCAPNHLSAGTACGDQGDPCAFDDACDGLGACTDFGFRASGTPCGDISSTACDAPDSCDGAGSCDSRFVAAGTGCGDQGVDCLVDDTCDGAGSCLDNGFEPANTPCGDPTADVCTAPDTCNGAGSCDARDLPAGVPCGDQGVVCHNDDSCDGAGSCQDWGPEPDGTVCNDGMYCTISDMCTSGVCGGSPRDCSGTGDSCAGGVCNEDADACEPGAVKPDGAECDDGVFCTVGETCFAGACQPGQPRQCGANECTEAVCNEAAEICELTIAAGGTACGEAVDGCAAHWACDVAGACVDSGPKPEGTPCGDPAASDCTAPDTCDAAGGCVENHAAAGTACGDPAASDCTAPDTCDGAGACQPNHAAAGVECGDTGLACHMTDTCDGAGVCLDAGFVPDGVGCEDGLYCTVEDSCVNGRCEPGGPLDCGVHANDCRDVACDEVAGTCLVTSKALGTPCGDQSDGLCTDPDSCDGAGTCLSNHVAAGITCVEPDGACTLGAACTNDGRCDSLGFAVDGTPCDDGDPCTPDDSCVAGVCRASDEGCADLNDGCAVGYCDPDAGGCVRIAPDDGSGCPFISSRPSPVYYIGVPYHYDEDGRAEATGLEPVTWTLVEGPEGMSVATNGEITWMPTTAAPVHVVLRAENPGGEAIQTFEIIRPVVEAPYIVQDAQLSARVGESYMYNPDGRISLGGVAEGEIVETRLVEGPEGMAVNPETFDIGWLPREAGSHEVVLELESEGTDAPWSVYSFVVTATSAVTSPDIEAVAIVRPDAGPAPMRVTLDGSLSHGTNGASLLLYKWNLGDGSRLSTDEALSSHIYMMPMGTTVSLLVRDELGHMDEDKVKIRVMSGENMPPSAFIHADPLTATAPAEVTFSCDCEDEDGSIIACHWQLTSDETAVGREVTHTFTEPATYRVRLMVEDDSGLMAYDSQLIDIRPPGEPPNDLRPPRATIYMTAVESEAPSEIVFVADAQDPDGVVVSREWTFHDGTTSTEPGVMKLFEEPGFYDVALTVVDNDGLKGFDTATVVVRQSSMLPPRIISAPSEIAKTGEAYVYGDFGPPQAMGSPPLLWQVGKVVGGRAENVPPGMSIDPYTGHIVWVPTHDQIGTHKITMSVLNILGRDVQEWEIQVVEGPKHDGEGDGTSGNDRADSRRSGCGCQGTSGTSMLLLLAALVLCLRRREV